MSGNDAQTKVAIMAASEQNHTHLSSLLGEAGLDVVMHEVAGEEFLRQLEHTHADVLLVDLSDDVGSEVDVIDTLLEYDSLPVLFNDSSMAGGETNALWAKKLARKLEQMVRDFKPDLEPELELVTEPEALQAVDQQEGLDFETGLDEVVILEQAEDFDLESTPVYEQVPVLDTVIEAQHEAELELVAEYEDQAFGQETDTDHSLGKETLSTIEDEISEEIEGLPPQDDGRQVAVRETSYVDKPEGAAKNVWVLGASLGGPQAVRQFLMAIKEDLPVGFILAQHIGENHISLLAEQLDRVSKFKVFPGYNGHMIRHHEVILAPAGKNIHITEDGYVSLSEQEANAIYSPCINDVMTAVAKRYGNMAGTIVFSGMGDDGAIGCQSVADNGGVVWAQDVESCVISSMPDQARKTNNVTFSANPRRLADELYKYYME